MVAASDGDALEHLSSVENILKTNYAIRDPAVLRKPDTADRVIYLFLDAAEFTDWAALVKNDRGEFLLLEEELVVEPGRSG